ncbi:phosphatidylinositol N-acetylglucosaminyltransferase-domain-containing protein [Dioszegia hungarica]|uniref:Phosphatidylinositol N-acetylglucosaminyltransferase-domain-containing protein n=1 Tax=Dioszegia hungarica TaxID=4972 RepID=A0AA38H3U8_9TREE|nr:phosphatidylinositol N-acetylglucosaminyltransferase-domain-containing protein [Dioszegia hungarica]KAI9632299.1 phosphatidylinositol N-acetylglucosaminyltransferase-domain-containing protein [Dioszegia hungarica]
MELCDASHTSGASKTTWEKVLWRRQPFPDNYVPPSFLAELKDLPVRARPSFTALVITALPISQHLGVTALFLAVFYGLMVGELGAGEIGWTCVLGGLGAYMIRHVGWGTARKASSTADRVASLLPPSTPLRPLMLPPLLLSLLSPVLGTLTSATTSDSIWPLAGGLFFVHLLLADFSTGTDARIRRLVLQRREAKRRGSISAATQLEEVQEKSLTSSLSLTSALSASIVLASRLSSTAEVFSLVLLAVALFAGWPNIAKGIREAGKAYSLVLTLSTILAAVSLFPSTLLAPATLIFAAALFLVNIAGPGMLWYGWRWKTRRGGGWDVAVVRDGDRNSSVDNIWTATDLAEAKLEGSDTSIGYATNIRNETCDWLEDPVRRGSLTTASCIDDALSIPCVSYIDSAVTTRTQRTVSTSACGGPLRVSYCRNAR